MKDAQVAWLNSLIDRGRILFVEGKDLRTPEAGIEWQGRADQLLQEARAGVKARSPDDAKRLETLSPYPPVDLDPGNPWWTPTLAFSVASCKSSTSSILCEENHPVSYHLALANRLEEIVSDWRANPPLPPRRIAAAERKMKVSLSSAETQCRKWLIEEFKTPRAKRKVDYQEEVLGEEWFDGLSERAFLRAWDEARESDTTDQSWHKRGPVGSSRRGV